MSPAGQGRLQDERAGQALILAQHLSILARRRLEDIEVGAVLPEQAFLAGFLALGAA
ncbi:MAG: hypothetical protein ABSA18_14085 [Dehalococcoidia bacterium]